MPVRLPLLRRDWTFDCQPSTTGMVLVSLAAALILSTMLVYLLMRCAVHAARTLHAVHAVPAVPAVPAGAMPVLATLRVHPPRRRSSSCVC